MAKKSKYKCIVKTVCGKRRRLCYGKKGIRTNTKA